MVESPNSIAAPFEQAVGINITKSLLGHTITLRPRQRRKTDEYGLLRESATLSSNRFLCEVMRSEAGQDR